MSRSWLIWLVFLLCVATLLAAMGWVSVVALKSEASEARAIARSDFEEDVRLALWRMDALLGSIVNPEAARPYYAYRAYYSPPNASEVMAGKGKGLPPTNARDSSTNFLIASPLRSHRPDHVLLYFQLSSDGGASSPQGPTELLAPLNGKAISPDDVALADQRLRRLQRSIYRWQLAAHLPRQQLDTAEPIVVAQRRVGQSKGDPTAQGQLAFQPQQAPSRQGRRFRGTPSSQQQVANREGDVRNSLQALAQSNFFNGNTGVFNPPGEVGDVVVGAMKPMWLDGKLLLARRVSVGKKKSLLQGAWLDWTGVELLLKDSIADLFPEAELRPAASSGTGLERRLTALPVAFLPGDVPLVQLEQLSPLRVSLLVGWGCVVLAAAAVAVLLLGVMRLSERRASFVSSVTHELRTPLTTFRMYTEMLSAGMVPDGAKRQGYLDTLRVESDRLGHLVENVLSYARLERGNPRRRCGMVEISQVVARVQTRLGERAGQAEMQLEVDVPEEFAHRRVLADVSVVEQILFNLVDNASKYAVTAQRRELHLEAEESGNFAVLSVRDHGPGIPPELRRRLFRPFSKSAQEAAHSAPGVGLGLALSRRLARQMGGDLRLDKSYTGGACFQVWLKCAK